MNKIEKIKDVLQDIENDNINSINKELLISVINKIDILLNDIDTIIYHNNKNNKLNWKY